MTAFGFFLSCEEFTPAELLEQAALAERAGFTRLAISDHYHPWTDQQGNSPFVWSMIGAISQVSSLPVTTLVTCPTVRIHPAVVAQAAATSSVLTSGRFALGVGTGEALNEHVVGGGWPPFQVRAEMLEEAIGVIRRLFTGEVVNHHGRHYTVENARIYNPPVSQVPIYVSAFGVKAAELAARVGDGLVTTMPDAGLVRRYRTAGGGRRPVIAGTKVCWNRDRDEAVRTMHRLWASEFLPGELNQILPTPSHFEQASRLVTEQMVAESATCGADPAAHLDHLREFVDADFDEVYVGQVGPQYDGFFDFYGHDILPVLHDRHPVSH